MSEYQLEIGIFEEGRSVLAKISGIRGHPPPIFAQLDRPVNGVQLCHKQYSHKETL